MKIENRGCLSTLYLHLCRVGKWRTWQKGFCLLSKLWQILRKIWADSLLFGKVKVALQTVQSCNFYWSMWCVIWSTVDGCKRYCIEWFTDMYLLTPSNRVFVPFTLYQIIQVNHFVKLSWSQKQSIFHWSMHCNLTHLCFIKALCESLHGLCGHLQKTSYNPCHEWKGTWSTLSCVMSLHWMNDLRFYDFFCRTRRRKRSNNKQLWAEYMQSHQQLCCESDIHLLIAFIVCDLLWS